MRILLSLTYFFLDFIVKTQMKRCPEHVWNGKSLKGSRCLEQRQGRMAQLLEWTHLEGNLAHIENYFFS